MQAHVPALLFLVHDKVDEPGRVVAGVRSKARREACREDVGFLHGPFAEVALEGEHGDEVFQFGRDNAEAVAHFKDDVALAVLVRGGGGLNVVAQALFASSCRFRG